MAAPCASVTAPLKAPRNSCPNKAAAASQRSPARILIFMGLKPARIMQAEICLCQAERRGSARNAINGRKRLLLVLVGVFHDIVKSLYWSLAMSDGPSLEPLIWVGS